MSNNPSDPNYDSTNSPNVVPEKDDDQFVQDTGAYPGTGEEVSDESLEEPTGE